MQTKGTLYRPMRLTRFSTHRRWKSPTPLQLPSRLKARAGGRFHLVRPRQRGVGTCLVIVLSRSFDFALCVGQRQEPMEVQSFGAEAPFERFDFRIATAYRRCPIR